MIRNTSFESSFTFDRMSAFSLRNFEISSKVDLNLKVDKVHIFDDAGGLNMFLITSDDKVYAYGSNKHGCCGLGTAGEIATLTNIPELSDKRIEQFFTRNSFVLALNRSNRLFSWGSNGQGELGIGVIGSYTKPQLIFALRGETIINIGCGNNHSLALTSSGAIYGWGCNTHGQLGCGHKNNCPTPVKLKFFKQIENCKIKNIYCSFHSSFVLTTDGKVYSWGLSKNQLGYDLKMNEIMSEPMLIEISNVISVCPSAKNTYFLTEEGIVYWCGIASAVQNVPVPMENDFTLKSMQYYYTYRKQGNNSYNIISTATDDNFVYLFEGNRIVLTKYDFLSDFYCTEYQMTFGTIDMKQHSSINSSNDSDICIQSEDLNDFRSGLKEIFKVSSNLGSGGFGKVFKVQCSSDQGLYAVKWIQINALSFDKFMEEVNILSKCSEEFVVKYYDSWIHCESHLYIQMELCSDNLDNIIQQKSQCFDRKPFELMNSIEYYISCQLFKELLECVQYLHESNPPIIHRDLKPQNILITQNQRNGRFLKICDFGLSAVTDFNTISHTCNIGTLAYTAPEVCHGIDGKSRYSTKADIYSVGVISQKLFDLDINSSEDIQYVNENLKTKRNQLLQIILSMTKNRYIERPTCTEVLAQFNLFSIGISEVKNCEFYLQDLDKMRNFSILFFIEYLKEKLLMLE